MDIEAIRRAILDAIPDRTSEHGQALESRLLYVPPIHARALSIEHPLVVGIRGAGKSVWWAALQDEELRSFICQSLGRSDLSRTSHVSAGFGERARPSDYPDKRTIRSLTARGHRAVDIWRAVVANHTWGKQKGSEMARFKLWADRLAWLDSHPEEAAQAFADYDQRMAEQGKVHLILFDAIDRSADDWLDLRRLASGLLELLLEVKSYQAIRAKAFLRPDMLDDPQATAYRDASKVMTSDAELRWDRASLYALFFHRLANAPGGETFRRLCSRQGGCSWKQAQNIWQVPKELQIDEELQRTIFHALAGDQMGTDPRRGRPYTWLTNHLADAASQVSPRSFLAALRVAAEESEKFGNTQVLHYEAIKRGVQKASGIRVKEVKEDYFWVDSVMKPLRDLVIPCLSDEITNRWKQAGVEAAIREAVSNPRRATATGTGLPPENLDKGIQGLKADMLKLAMFSPMRDGRINMPDVYRVGFGLGRRGGVKPIR